MAVEAMRSEETMKRKESGPKRKESGPPKGPPASTGVPFVWEGGRLVVRAHGRFYLPAFAGMMAAVGVFVLLDLLAGRGYPAGDVAYAFLLAGLGWGTGVLWDALPRVRDRMELLRYRSALLERREDEGPPVPPEPNDAQSISGKETFAALAACDAAWRGHAARMRERLLFAGAFSARFAHEMKTPLFALRLLGGEIERLFREAAQLSEGGASQDRAASLFLRWQELRRTYAAELRRAEDLVDLLLGAVRLEDPARDYVPEEIPLVAFIRELVDARREEWILHRIFPRFEVEGAEGAYRVFADRKWLRFLVEQILRNALRYGKKEGAASAAFRVRFAREGGRIRVLLEDEGPGIPPEDLPRVFDPFFTGTHGRRNPSATGIGLYLAREAAARLGVRLDVRSAWGRGTTFVIEFPEAMYFAPARAGTGGSSGEGDPGASDEGENGQPGP